MEEQARQKHQTAGKIRETIGPLVANLKRLTPSQRERATELMFQADTIQAGVDEIIARKDKMIADGSWHKEPTLTVTGMIHPGVRPRFEDLEFITREVIHGPVKISKHRGGEGEATALVCANQLSGSKRELLAQKFVVELPPEADEESDQKDLNQPPLEEQRPEQ